MALAQGISFSTGTDRSYFRAENIVNFPFTLMGWFMWTNDDNTDQGALFCHGTAAPPSGTGSSFYCALGDASPHMYIWGGATNSAASSVVIALNTWYHVACVWRDPDLTDNDINGYINGTLECTHPGGASAVSPLYGIGFVDAFRGRWAAFKGFVGVLSPGEIIRESFQVAPFRGGCFTLNSPKNTLRHGIDEIRPGYGDWTLAGTATDADGPPIPWVYTPKRNRRRFRTPSGGSERTMVANLQATADWTALLKPDRNAAASWTSTADLAALLKVDRQLIAPLSASSDLAALLKVDRNMVASWTSTADFAAVLKADRKLVASLDALATLAAHVCVDRPLAANLTVTSDWTAVLSKGGVKDFAAALTATADLAAVLKADRPLAANLQATADWTAVLSTGALKTFAAVLSATADLVALLNVDRNLAANLIATADIAAVAKYDRNLSALLSASADIAALLKVDRKLVATLLADANFLAALTTNAIFRTGILDAWVRPDSGKTWERPFSGKTWDLQ